MAQYSPSEGSCRVFIIDEVHMLSKGAFNALLKILEEPPARVFFFFAMVAAPVAGVWGLLGIRLGRSDAASTTQAQISRQ